MAQLDGGGAAAPPEGPVDFGRLKRSNRERLLHLLLDLAWHHHTELAIAGNRYSARVLELKAAGWQIEHRDAGDGVGREYRLTAARRGAPQLRQVRVYLSPADAESVARGFPSRAAQTACAGALASFGKRKGLL